jgi:hypothetical protein
MGIEKILKLGIALGFLGLGICGCSNKKQISEETVFEQKTIDYKGNLSKVVDGVKIDASFSNPKHYCFYGEGRANGIQYSDRDCQFRVGLWSDAEFPKETNSSAIAGWLNGPYLQMVGIRAAESIISNSETRLSDYFHNDGNPEVFAVPVIMENKFGIHVFFDEDYIKKNKPEVALVYDIAGKKKVGNFFSYLGRIKLKKSNGAYCGYFEVNDAAISKYRTIFLIGNFKKKEASIPIENGSEKRELINNLQCSKKLAEIIGNDDCIMLGFSERLYE